jgi:hypothetical protein
MSDERCPAMRPKLGIRCARRATHCWGSIILGLGKMAIGNSGQIRERLLKV